METVSKGSRRSFGRIVCTFLVVPFQKTLTDCAPDPRLSGRTEIGRQRADFAVE